VKVVLRNPDRELDVAGDRLMREVLADLAIDPDTVLVIRDGELITRHERVDDADAVEVRPVISGGTR
jgi:sulfur carrier protein ThiS